LDSKGKGRGEGGIYGLEFIIYDLGALGEGKGEGGGH
jgi:hypothetical protein